MCGRMNDSDGGQLALMDAVVFFAASMLISTALLAYASDFAGPGSIHACNDWRDPDEVLHAFLHASVGTELIVNLNSSVQIKGNEEIAECIAIETQALRSGAGIAPFEELNDVCLRILRSCSAPLYEPFLIVLCSDANGTEPILAIPWLPENHPEAHASSAEFPGLVGETILVTLILCPASSPELA